MKIKSFTDLGQSKKLAEILPLETADMIFDGVGYELGIPKVKPCGYVKSPNTLPCWSLAALISLLPDEIKHDGIVNNLWITSEDVSYYSKEYVSYLYYEEGCTVDACVNMILKLKEEKKL